MRNIDSLIKTRDPILCIYKKNNKTKKQKKDQ